jgi:hypothetical protein
MQRVDPFDSSKHARVRLTRVGSEGAERDVHGRMRSPSDAQPMLVHDGPACLVAHVNRDVFQLIVNNV